MFTVGHSAGDEHGGDPRTRGHSEEAGAHVSGRGCQVQAR